MIVVVAILIMLTMAAAAFVLAPRLAQGRVVYETAADRPVPFGYRMAWLAIRTRDTARVVNALGLHGATPANWKTGIGVVYDRRLGNQRVFVSPPVNGWTFVVGLALPHPVGPAFVDKCTPLLVDLGTRFIEVQYFFTYPAIDFHAWARVVDGRLVRGFATGDEGVVWNVGKPTREEKALGLKLFELRGVRGRKGDAGGELILHPTEEHVRKVAARWSIDPIEIDKIAGEPQTGLVGIAPLSWSSERLRRSA